MLRTLSLALALSLLSTPVLASSKVSTNVYSSTSTSDDIALSCNDFIIGATTGVVYAMCNKKTDGTVSRAATRIDLDDEIACEVKTDGTVLVFGSWSADNPGSIESWSISTDSTGDDYVVSGACALDGEEDKPTSSLELSDTTDGLENDAGGLDGR